MSETTTTATTTITDLGMQVSGNVHETSTPLQRLSKQRGRQEQLRRQSTRATKAGKPAEAGARKPQREQEGKAERATEIKRYY